MKINLEKIKKALNKENFFSLLKKLIKKFPQAEIYLVGGAVRDLILERKTRDFDFVVRKVPAEDLENFLASFGKVNSVGKAFSVFKFVPKNGDPHNPIDFALPRKEHAFGTGGYKDVVVKSDPKMPIKEDLSRRDFTINAIALKFSKLEPLKFKIIDPFQGRLDLKKKIVRTVGQAETRFKEDYSRMLRAIRFSVELNFQIEERTSQILKKEIKHLNDLEIIPKMVERGYSSEQEVEEKRIVPYEVIAKEFLKSLRAQAVETFDLYDEFNVWQEIIPEMLKMKNCPQPKEFHSEGDVWTHTRLALTKLYTQEFKKEFGQEPLSLELILAVLFHDLGKPYTIQTPEKDGVSRIRFHEHDSVGANLTKKICQRLRLSSPEDVGVETDKIVWLVQNHMILVAGDISKMRPGTIEKYFFHPRYSGNDLLKLSFVDIAATILETGKPNFTNFYQMKKRIKEIKNLSQTKKELPPPLLDGHEIMEKFGFPPGPAIGRFLEKLREKQLAKKIKTKEEALAYLAKIIKNEKS
ncbi:MAG: HD domain-containing protein [Patescibacteria group bacterium]|nr:HD domain-containing protein [Patescibacteria group bacterium]